jgi:rubredoxin
MAVRYVCDSCGYRGFDPRAGTADEVLCNQCGEPVLTDLDDSPSTNRGDLREMHERPQGLD